MKEREKLQFEGPLGSFFLRDSQKPALFIASGTGYAPIRSMLLKHLPMNTGRQMILFWGGRTRKDLYMMDEALQWCDKYANFRFIPVLSEAASEDEWAGASGLVHCVAMDMFQDLSDWQVYACGAPVMVEAALLDFVAKCGLPETEFFADSFVSRADLARSGSI
jgi:CDP-4-dehydro-6-deoxyglucose reductase, E3